MQSSKIKKVKKNLFVGLAINLFLVLAKGITGIIGNSFALIADAIESLADIFASILSIFGFSYASRPPDEDHPYGHGKAEPLITFIIVLFLILSAVFIIFQSFKNFYEPQKTPKVWTLYILALIILAKEIYYRYSIRNNLSAGSSVLNAEAEHHRSDAMTSLAAFLGISVAVFMGPGYEIADDIAALIAGIIILFNAYKILRPALGEVMDEHLYDDFIAEIRNSTLEVNGALATDKCWVRKQGIYFLVDLHLIVDGEISVDQGHEIAHAVKKHLIQKHPSIYNVLIHVEPFKKD
ncbi:Ferrous-iron efflux pump FieF [Candidatus Ornithobacterium hominis]|uniref:Ferrous-iron efflux pump FieF n=1 Tax=Candidatus Ornithobacterium hominis TaxID=2497989 RepID=A0A383TZ48_9FLAO|nr:cation diffusion facilitator family transporter [Candidatus Ornithobacterium hominis]MCT7903953.1 cation diffusion facilitator family transporter [Candidatus Ornithobacterium hominis]SZD72510.1 Ferrous-iron efflux pump FieF [Candidatus Ornithobacterium hominis]